VSRTTFFLPEALHDYVLRTSLREADAQRAVREEAAAIPRGGIQSSPEQVQFIALLVRLIGARRCLEIGVFTGYSALGVALALPPDGTIVACEVDAEAGAVARAHWQRAGVAAKIDLRIAPALETLDSLLAEGGAGSFDFAYIDADKSNGDAYYERCLALLRPNGLVAVDNVLWRGAVADPGAHGRDVDAIKAFNAKAGRDERVDVSIVPIGDGVLLARKR
jgi:predicted O-methyltransferase YrrM